MPRRADPPAVQAAKGHPGRRPKAVAARAAKVEQLVGMLKPAASADGPPPPAYLTAEGFEVALAIWLRLAPELAKTHRLPPETRDNFATYCVYAARWLEAQLDINARGMTQRVKTVAGGHMERDRPVLRHQQQAFDNMMKLSDGFGLTPRDLYGLFKDQAMAAASSPGLFDRQPTERPAPAGEPADRSAAGLIGSGDRLKSKPPAPALN